MSKFDHLHNHEAWSGNYLDTRLYKKGAIVEWNSKYYVCVKKCTKVIPDTNSEYWHFFVDGSKKEFQKPNPTGLAWKGKWSESLHYSNGDIVVHNHHFYVRISDCSSSEPNTSDCWEQIQILVDKNSDSHQPTNQ